MLCRSTRQLSRFSCQDIQLSPYIAASVLRLNQVDICTLFTLSNPCCLLNSAIAVSKQSFIFFYTLFSLLCRPQHRSNTPRSSIKATFASCHFAMSNVVANYKFTCLCHSKPQLLCQSGSQLNRATQKEAATQRLSAGVIASCLAQLLRNCAD